VLGAAAALAAAFAALAALVGAGALDAVDQFGVDHLMPGLQPHGRPSSHLSGLVPLRHAASHGALRNAADVVTLPGSPLVTLLLVAVLGESLRRRGRLREELAWIAAFAAGLAIEVVGKTVIERPPLERIADGVAVHVVGFDNSFPSGHTIRIVLLVALASSLAPRALPWLAAWAAAALALLEVAGFHAPVDIAAGLVLALLLALGPRALRT
jgi:membrane-associated phospholipid phosphatase